MKKLIVNLIWAGALLLFLFTGCGNSDPYLTLSGYSAPESIKVNTDYNIEGTIQCNDTIKCAGIRIKDNLSNTYEISKTLNNHENVFELNRLNEYVDFGKLTKGEKTIEVIAVRNNSQEVLQKDIFIVE